MATTRKRPKLLSGGLVQAGVKNKAKRKRIKERIIAGGKGGLKKAGITSGQTRRIIRENVTIAAKKRAKRRAQDRKRSGPKQVQLRGIFPLNRAR